MKSNQSPYFLSFGVSPFTAAQEAAAVAIAQGVMDKHFGADQVLAACAAAEASGQLHVRDAKDPLDPAAARWFAAAGEAFEAAWTQLGLPEYTGTLFDDNEWLHHTGVHVSAEPFEDLPHCRAPLRLRDSVLWVEWSPLPWLNEGGSYSRVWSQLAEELGGRDQVLAAKQAFERAGGRASPRHPDVERWFGTTRTIMGDLLAEIPEEMEISRWDRALHAQCYIEVAPVLPPEFGGPAIDVDAREGPAGVSWRGRWRLPEQGRGLARHASGMSFNICGEPGAWRIEPVQDERVARRIHSFAGAGHDTVDRATAVLREQLARLLLPLAH